jgi:hypothetical protein
MDSYETARLISATACGAQLGAFLMLSLLNRPLLNDWPNSLDTIWVFKRFYRLNTVLAIFAGIFAVLGNANEPGFLFAILGFSYVLAHLHLLRAMSLTQQNSKSPVQAHLKRSPRQLLQLLKLSQQLLHITQIFGLIYLLSSLI